MLLQNGADTQRVEETIHRLGTALGCDWLDIVILPDAIIASTINNSEFRTKSTACAWTRCRYAENC